MTEAPTRLRPARLRNRRYIGLVVLVLLLAGGWIALWKYTSQATLAAIEGWRAREARAGRIYTCGSEQVGGFPFRIEVLCDRAGAVLKTAQPPVELKTANIHVAAQVYQPKLLISEFTGPLTIAEPGQPPAYVVDWALAQSSVRGTPQAPERVSIVTDRLIVNRTNPNETLMRADHLELHGRLAEGSVANRPVIEVAVRTTKLQAPAVGSMAAAPIDADIDAVMRGLNDFSPKPWPARFREIQQAGGRIEIRQARVQQGDTIAVGSGTLSINADGRLEGQINMLVAGLEAFINKVAAANSQRLGFTVTLGLGLLGGNKQIEGRPAIAIPLRISDGTMMLGPIKIGEVPPLF
jgi:hypothetical protein